jgi:hypothetical protein
MRNFRTGLFIHKWNKEGDGPQGTTPIKNDRAKNTRDPLTGNDRTATNVDASFQVHVGRV